ncbi:MAG: hypothetical protein ACYC9Y_02755 [Candidatus Methylomirabilia bacterium]
MKTARGVLAGLGLIAVFPAGFVTGKRAHFDETRLVLDDNETRQGLRAYTSPLLECEVGSERLSLPLRSFGGRLYDLVESLERERRAPRLPATSGTSTTVPGSGATRSGASSRPAWRRSRS